MTSPAAESRLDPDRLHADSLVWNACDSTSFDFGDETFVDKIVRSKVSACIHTVVIWENAAQALEEMVKWRRLYDASPHLRIGLRAEDAVLAKRAGQTAMFMGWQDISGLEGRLDLIDAFHALGMRVLQPTYQHRNLAGDGCGEIVQSGLSRFGVELVRRCNALRIALDVSHVSEPTSFSILEHSTAPVMATHSGAKGVADVIRNKSGELIRALARSGGLIGIPGKSGFLRKDGLAKGTSLDDYVDHVAYVCDLVGPDHVAIGTDVSDERRYTPAFLKEFHRRFPEVTLVDATMDFSNVHPVDLRTPAEIPNITHALVRRGFREDDIRKILGGNVQRVMEAVIG